MKQKPEAEIIPIPGTSKMRAAFFEEHGTPARMRYGYVDRPRPGPDEVLIQVKACALNHLDLWTLQGMPGVKIPLPHIPGCDVSGIVIERGNRARHIPLGKPVLAAPGISCGTCSFCKTGWDSLCDRYRILGFQIPGGLAEYVAVPAANVTPVSTAWSFEEWAAVPLVFLTAWHMLITRAAVRRGETVLIQAGGSGVGSAAIQIAKYAGARVLTTVGSDEKIRKARALGADEVIPSHRRDFAADIHRLTRGRGVDIVFEHVGGETFTKSLAALAKKGRLVTCGVTSGPMAMVDLRFIFVRQLSIFGSYMGGKDEWRRVLRLIAKKKLRPVVDKVFPLREAREALERMQTRENFGKIVVVP